MKIFSSLLLAFTLVASAYAQSDADRPVIVEAESGPLGSEMEVRQDGDVEYVTVTTNTVLAFPGSEERIATYEVTFPAAGAYDLFARLRVGPNGNDDDSFYYGNGFGTKSPRGNFLWTTVNGLNLAGFTSADQYVAGPGSARNNVWKWVNLSKNGYGEPPITFTVEEGALTQTFQIGGGEDGLDIDKLAFANAELYYTVGNLENSEAGSTELPDGEPSEGPLAAGFDKFLGNVYSTSQLPNFDLYWNQVTPENAGKWGSVEPGRDAMNWGPLDAAYNFAKNNGFPFRFHVLVWGNQQPSWIESLSPSQQLEEIEEWFAAVAERYPDIDYLEVVNEPLHDPPNSPGDGGGNYIEALGGTGDTGWDWVLNAFRLAREYFPDTHLMINDFGILGSLGSAQQYHDLIELLQDEDLIDGIGVQGHAFSTRGSEAGMQAVLDLLAETGLPIQVTELDVDGPTDDVQLDDYRRIFPTLWEHPSVEGITLWGWRTGMWRTDQGAYLIRQDGTERPAMEWLRSYMASFNVDVDAPDVLPQSFRIVSNYPNPFNPSTQITYELRETAHVSMRVYDARGRLRATLTDDVRPAGSHTVTFDAGDLASGIYMVRLHADGQTSTRPIVLLR